MDNKLSLQLGKTECIVFGSKRKSKLHNFNVKCNDHTIVSQSSVEHLGSICDTDLSATSIVTKIIKKVNSRIRFFRGVASTF